MALADGNITIALSELTPRWLKANYLTGLKFVDEHGKEFPDSLYETHLANAVEKLEKLCDICVLPRDITAEEHDYHAQDYLHWGWMRLFKVPILEVTAFRGVYPAGSNIIEYPVEMVKVRRETGQINLVVTNGALSSVIVGQGGDFLPLIYAGVSHVPNLWQVDYSAGMDVDNLPRMIVEAIAKLAACDLLTIFSDLIRPIGISSESASIDGLSQSMSYQAPAFQARLTRYDSDLYGPSGKRQDLAMTSGLLKQIYDAYRPINFESI
jgi:hypothetical protein